MRFLWCAMVVTACGGSSAPPLDTPDGEPTRITIETVVPPALVAYREEPDGEWQTPTTLAPASFEGAVGGPYTVVTVCNPQFSPLRYQYQTSRALEDDPQIVNVCGSQGEGPLELPYRAMMKQPGRAQVNSTVTSSDTPDWEVTLYLRQGPNDVFAWSTTDIMIRHGLVVPDQPFEDIDLTVEGKPWVPVSFTTPNAMPGETLSVDVTIGRTIYFDIDEVALVNRRVAPDSVLIPTDRQQVELFADLPDARRLTTRAFRSGDDPAIVLPEPVGPVQCDELAVTWSTLPAHDMLRFSATQTAASLRHIYEATSAFVTTTGSTSLTFHSDLPGYLPGWKIDTSQPYRCVLTALDGSSTQDAESTESRLGVDGT